VPEWIQTYEKAGGFKLPLRKITAATLRKSRAALTTRREAVRHGTAKIGGRF